MKKNSPQNWRKSLPGLHPVTKIHKEILKKNKTKQHKNKQKI